MCFEYLFVYLRTMKTNYKSIALALLLIAGACSSENKSGADQKLEEELVNVDQPVESETEEKAPVNLKDLKIPIPTKYELLDSVSGDLNKDNIPELVVAYNTPLKDEMDGNKRSLCIYRLKNDQWELWKESKSALLGSQDGGMDGDPFGDLEISKGVLIISHNGGSSWKWFHADKYRAQQDDFVLIGYSSNYGKPCEYWQNEDFNVSTGKFVYEKEHEICREHGDSSPIPTNPDDKKETFYKKGIRLTLSNRHDKEISFKTPKGEDIYL